MHEISLVDNHAELSQIVAYESTIYPSEFVYPLEGRVCYAQNPAAIMVALGAENEKEVTHFACGCLVNASAYKAFIAGEVTERDFDWYSPPDMLSPTYFYLATVWRKTMPHADCLLPFLKKAVGFHSNT